MKTLRTLLFSLLLTLVVWGFFAWPLPKHFAGGMPSSATNVEKFAVRRMFHGDHLQLLYNYWLFSDMVAGKTPFFYNLYEFNRGDDEERRYVGIDDFPFCIVFALGHRLGGRAVGWNLTGFAALWITHFFTWLLVRRYLRRDTLAALVAVVAIAAPYRWATMLGGSPTGFAMTWVPLLLWGIEAVMREQRLGGGLAVGAAVFFSFCNDAHVFFFSLLLAPCWAALLLLTCDEVRPASWRWWRRTVVAGLPAIVLTGLAIAWGQMKQSGFEETTVAKGRSMGEVALFSPHPAGLTAWRGFGHDSSIYIGYVAPAVLAAGIVIALLVLLGRGRERWRPTLALLALSAGVVILLLLALGPFGPRDGKVFMLARRLIPPYQMIRQPAKIFCVLPPILAVAWALALAAFVPLLEKLNRRATGLVFTACLLLAVEYGLQVRPTICLLDREQGAYAAVATDAESRQNDRPHAVVLPLWPGDSAWASLYEHYVSLYRIRMVNGYMPVVSTSYIEDIFNRFASANCGLFSDAQADELLRRGIDYLILHEDAFPEKVSHFPVAFTLKRLLNHPRLELLAQDGSVWSFRILPEPRAHGGTHGDGWTTFFPNFHFEAEWLPLEEPGVTEDATASGNRFVRATPALLLPALDPLEHLRSPDTAFLLRLRGDGGLAAKLTFDDGRILRRELRVDSPDWEWRELRWDAGTNGLYVTPEFQVSSGQVDVDLVLFTAGRLPELAPGETCVLPAPLFFRAGHTVLQQDAVRLRREYEPADAIFYGPKLPFPADGVYDVELVFHADAAEGAELGHFYIETEKARTADAPVVAKARALSRLSSRRSNLPFTLRFVFYRNADIDIREVRFTRIE
jgi:hypothetical protein